MSDSIPQIQWHELIGRFFALVFEPLKVQVRSELPLLSHTVKSDIVLLQRNNDYWTNEQRQWMADGLRHAEETNLLINFKYSEGLNLDTLEETNTCDYLYRRVNRCARSDLASFLVVASIPRDNWCQQLDFVATEWAGVYRSSGIYTKRVMVILLNELESTPHNAPLKCFASKRGEQEKAFASVQQSGFTKQSRYIGRFITKLRKIVDVEYTTTEITPDMVMEMGSELIDFIMKTTALEKVLHHHKPDEVLSHFNEEQIRAYLAKLQH